jgi:hypothetical protein
MITINSSEILAVDRSQLRLDLRLRARPQRTAFTPVKTTSNIAIIQLDGRVVSDAAR